MSDDSTSRASLVAGASGDNTAAWVSNVTAGRQVADTVRTTLGPKGLDKMLIRDGEIVVTNDGASILDRMEIEHPAARLLVEVADQQNARAGDGTTSAVVFAGELLREAGELFELGVHPTKITEGYALAARRARELLVEQTVPFAVDSDDALRNVARTVVTGKWDAEATDFLAEQALEAVRSIERDERVAFEKITRKTIPGGSFYDSEVIQGLVIDLEESSTDVVSPDRTLPGEYRTATVVLIDEELSIAEPAGIGAVELESYEDYEAFREYEDEVYKGYVEGLTAVEADVIFCQQAIDDPVRYGLAAEGILPIERTRRDELYKLARATGARPVTMDELTPAVVGQASSVERRPVGATQIAVVSGVGLSDHVSVLFRGGTEHVAEETKRMLDDCFYALKLAIEDGAVLAGGGAVEVDLARQLRREAAERPGREQLAIEAFADALETIPRTLAASAGMDSVDALVALRTAHEAGDTTAGLDLDARAVVDTAEAGVLEPLHVKRQAITSAAEAANVVIRVDDNIPVTHDQEGHDHEDDHEDEHGLIHSTEGYPWGLGHSMGHSH